MQLIMSSTVIFGRHGDVIHMAVFAKSKELIHLSRDTAFWDQV